VIVMKMGDQYNIGGAFFEQVGRRILAMTLQKKQVISQNRVGQHTDLADVHQHGGMSNIV